MYKLQFAINLFTNWYQTFDMILLLNQYDSRLSQWKVDVA
jgi:hypothetical protein